MGNISLKIRIPKANSRGNNQLEITMVKEVLSSMWQMKKVFFFFVLIQHYVKQYDKNWKYK